jgi:hypothetical protein
VNFAEQPASKQWAALKYRGEKFAEVWFKPEGEPFALLIRVPQGSFQVPGIAPLLTAEKLLKAVGIPAEEVGPWRLEGTSPSGTNGPNPELGHPLPPPPQDVPFLTLHVTLKQPPEAVPPTGPPTESSEPEAPEGKWEELEARWKGILDLEGIMDSLRLTMEALQREMETASMKMLTMDEKLHAFNADIAQWNKAKSRVTYALPRVREVIHRSTWAPGRPERKKLEEIFKNHGQPGAVDPPVEEVAKLLDNVLKDWQVLHAHGQSVYQDCKSIAASVQGAMSTLLTNAAANAAKARAAQRKKGKYF